SLDPVAALAGLHRLGPGTPARDPALQPVRPGDPGRAGRAGHRPGPARTGAALAGGGAVGGAGPAAGAGVFRAWLLAAAGRGRVALGSGGGGCLDRGGGRPGGDRAAASAAGRVGWTRRRARMRRPSGSVPTIRPLLWWVCVRDEGKGEEGAQVGRDRPGGVRPGLGPVALRLWPLRRKRARRGGDGAAAGRRPDPDRPRRRADDR